MAETKTIVKTIFIIYLAIVSLIGLVMTITSTSRLVDMGLKTWVFTSADIPSYLENCDDPYESPIPVALPEEKIITQNEIRANCEERREKSIDNHKVEKAQDAVEHFSLIIVGIPLFIVHFRMFVKERREYDKKDKKDKK